MCVQILAIYLTLPLSIHPKVNLYTGLDDDSRNSLQGSSCTSTLILVERKNAFYDDDEPFLSELGDRMSHIIKQYTIAFGTLEYFAKKVKL